MSYVDAFVIALKKKDIPAYRRMSVAAGKVWRKYGAIDYKECVGDDLKVKMGVPFAKLARLKTGDTVVFSWILYKSRIHRDAVNAKVMKDKRIINMMKNKKPPFDMKRMSYGFGPEAEGSNDVARPRG